MARYRTLAFQQLESKHLLSTLVEPLFVSTGLPWDDVSAVVEQADLAPRHAQIEHQLAFGGENRMQPPRKAPDLLDTQAIDQINAVSGSSSNDEVLEISPLFVSTSSPWDDLAAVVEQEDLARQHALNQHQLAICGEEFQQLPGNSSEPLNTQAIDQINTDSGSSSYSGLFEIAFAQILVGLSLSSFAAKRREQRKSGFHTDFTTDYFSFFLSYSHVDEQFATQLVARLRKAGIRIWFAPENMKGGVRLQQQIADSIADFDKVLVILSDASTKSSWVRREIRLALSVERETGKQKLFPIRIVPYEGIARWECFDSDSGRDLAEEIRQYHIVDFSTWRDPQAFEDLCLRLAADLRSGRIADLTKQRRLK